ncbi:MAG: helix-turn-helix domain-containing protein [Chlamydiales bacterium]|nr:helix-turn-helix domain-containing protein [Chlamydiales bacterium]
MDHCDDIGAEHVILESFEAPITDHEPASPTSTAAGELPKGFTLEELEKRYIIETLQAQQNNRTAAAKYLGISVRTLRNKLNEYNVSE